MLVLYFREIVYLNNKSISDYFNLAIKISNNVKKMNVY